MTVTPVPETPVPETQAPEHTTAGREARERVHRRELGKWNPATRGHDALATILAQSDIRAPDLLPIRHGRMSHSPWTYYRGAAAVMAADLASAPHTGIMVQMCGDAHILNYGLWNSPERKLLFDLRDFDETLPGPFEWDLKRYLASVIVLARDNGLTESVGQEAVRNGYRSYRKNIRRYAQTPQIKVWYDQIDVERLLQYAKKENEEALDQLIEKSAGKRTSRGASKKLIATVEGRRQITEDPPYRTHRLGDDAEAVLQSVLDEYRKSVPDQLKYLLSRYDAVDAVRQVVGVGSVGMRVFLTLLEEQRSGEPLFFQVKQAGPSVYEQFLGKSQYENHGERVVQGQRLIQSATDMFVGWTTFQYPPMDLDLDFYVRQYRDGKVIPKGEGVALGLPRFAAACGHALARAHARSGDAAAIADYLGNSNKAEDALVEFASAYADQNTADHAQLARAVENGDIPSEKGWPDIP
ncbi:DUF2252 domain-containing protein [Nocardia sp. 348MFTsu5.1]|uniref:DUF2252 domain-containing protein n=1 Tax=Nocardia sp. 348MFTsu5.1 TaxID=1172185 RepID=UPI0003A6FAD1|nr:DUF2252 domain-containing protein [Nocardia sp. 348MFTsu5.1]